MDVSVSRWVGAFAAASLVLVPMTAMAQYGQVQVTVQPQYQPQQPVYVQQAPPPPPNAVAGDGQYVAPMQQQTQQTYVPQSVAMSGPRVIRDWHEGEPIPPGYHPSTRIRTGLVAGGASMFAFPYLFSVLAAAIGEDIKAGCVITQGQTCSNDAAPLFIPVVGPFITMGNSNSATLDVLLVVDGALQGVGVAMFIYGIVAPKVVLVRNDLGALKNITPTPLVGKNFTGLGVSAQF